VTARKSCGKTRYRDEIAAKLTLAQIRRKDRPTARERRIYRCPDCRGFHITSKGAKS
jgi:hypothetical protein